MVNKTRIIFKGVNIMKESKFLKVVAIFLAIVWVVIPDLIPGQIDDILVLLWTASEVKKFKAIPSK